MEIKVNYGILDQQTILIPLVIGVGNPISMPSQLSKLNNF